MLDFHICTAALGCTSARLGTKTYATADGADVALAQLISHFPFYWSQRGWLAFDLHNLVAAADGAIATLCNDELGAALLAHVPFTCLVGHLNLVESFW